MLQRQVYERLVRTVSGGVETDESRWDYDFIVSIADSMLAWAKQQYQVKFGKTPGQWFSTFHVPYDETIQEEECYKIFPVPEAITFPAGFTAINIGTGAGEFMSKYNSWTEMDAMRKHSLFKNKKGALISDGKAYVYTNMEIDEIFVEACIANLNDLDTFNPDFDDYRVTDEVLAIAEQELNKKYLILMVQRNPDLISSGKDTSAQQPQVQIPGTR